MGQLTRLEATTLLELMEKKKSPTLHEQTIKTKLRHIAYEIDEIPYCSCEKPSPVKFTGIKPYCRKCYGIIKE